MDSISLVVIGEIVAGAGLAALTTYLLLRPRLNTAMTERALARAQLDQLNAELETAKKQALIDAREEALRLKQEADAEVKLQKDALVKLEEKLDQRRERLEIREETVSEQSRLATQRESEALAKIEQAEQTLQQLSGLTREAARELFMERVEGETREAATRRAREIESQTIGEAERRARSAILEVIERCHVEYVTEATVAVVNLPTEEMKGRIIGRDGRNIRSFEQVAGVDLIIDDTPEAVVISCFDPIRRETARLALMNLMVDGRIHPGRIEELYEKAQTEVLRTISEAGERAVERAGLAGLPPRVVETMGQLRFRTSYGQNVLDHSVEVAHLAGMLAAELGCNADVARTAGFLHDLGKALGPEWEGPHALNGMEFLRQQGIKGSVLHAVGAHHHEIEPETAEAHVVIVADSVSAARPGARRESLDNYVKRLSSLEALANSFPGVERSYALQAGREVRLIVRPSEVDDLRAKQLAAEVARRIESEMEYPGQIRVTVIRETRVSDVAK